MKKFVLFMSFCIFLFAQDPETKTLTKMEDNKQKSTSEVILTQEDFKLNNCENVGDALQTITGVYVNSTGEIGLRDVSSSKVVVILDGQRLNTAGGITVNISSMPIENVETIELLRGGRSAQYGADAVGGVIVVTSKKGAQDAEKSKKAFFGARMAAGSYQKLMLNLNNSLSLGKFSSFISYQYDRSSDNYIYEYLSYGSYDFPRDTLQNNHKASNNIFAKLDYNLTEKQILSASFNHYGSHSGTPGMIENPTPNATLEFNNQSYNLAYSNVDLFKGFSLKGQAYYLDNQTIFDDDTENPALTPSDHKNYALGAELSQSGNINKILTANYGYSFRNDRINSTSVGVKVRNTHSAFAALNAGMDFNSFISRIEASIAGRFDAPSDFASALSPRFSFSMAHAGSSYSMNLKTHITRSYKAPTFNDLYWPKDAYSIGNPDLLPEYGLNYDVGLSLNWSNFMLSSNYFRNDVSNLIIWQQDPAVENLWTPKNISQTKTNGLETSASFSLWKIWTLHIEHTYMEARDNGPDINRHGKLLIYKPKNKFDISSSLKISGIEWNLNFHFIDYRYTDASNNKWLPAYATFDTNLSYRFSIANVNMNMIAEVNNIFNTPIMLSAGTAEAGRLMKITLATNF